MLVLLWNATVDTITNYREVDKKRNDEEIEIEKINIFRGSTTNKFRSKHAADQILSQTCLLLCLHQIDSSSKWLTLCGGLWPTEGRRAGWATSKATHCLMTTSDIYKHDVKPGYITAPVSQFRLCHSHRVKSTTTVKWKSGGTGTMNIVRRCRDTDLLSP